MINPQTEKPTPQTYNILIEYAFWWCLSVLALLSIALKLVLNPSYLWRWPEFIADNLGIIALGFSLLAFPWFFQALFAVYPLKAAQKIIKRIIDQEPANGTLNRDEYGTNFVINGENNTVNIKVKDDQTGMHLENTSVSVERLLNHHIRISRELASKIYNRAGVYLGVGVIIAFIGLGYFYSASHNFDLKSPTSNSIAKENKSTTSTNN